MPVRAVTILFMMWAVSSSIVAEEIPPLPATTYEVVDDLSYSQPTAPELWEPMDRTEPVSIVDAGGRKALRMPCHFQGIRVERASWDRRLKLDLAWRTGLQFLFYCRDATPVASFTVYLHSGDGWYRGNFDASSTTMWTPVQILKKDMTVEGRSYVAAWWHGDDGQSTGKPAILVSDNCICLTHVLIPDDRANKLRLLLAMIGHLVPESGREAARGALERIGRFGPYQDYDAAYRGIQELVSAPSDALSALQSADKRRREGLALLSEGQSSKAIVAAAEARQSMIQAYCLAQTPSPGEHRAFWCHSAFGVDGLDWDHAVKLLADNGFTAILPNMLWGGVAFYESDVLPRSATVSEKGDQIELCLAACRKYGVRCHIWKVNYNMGWATDKAFVAQRKAEGRTQVNADGAPNDRWLCPSHPENQRLEIESLLEIARKYEVDGLHFDYIRYPDSEGCFCQGCRTRFEMALGRKVNNWPADVRNEGELVPRWLDFRRQQITTVVAAVAGRARQIRPGIMISAAVFPNWLADRDAVGQDWRLWCQQGYLDFVCPMDYTTSGSHLQHLVAQQLTWAGKVPCYPGIGLSTWSDPTDICRLIEQINITRQLKTGGFTVFNYGPAEATQVLPLLGEGMTRRQ